MGQLAGANLSRVHSSLSALAKYFLEELQSISRRDSKEILVNIIVLGNEWQCKGTSYWNGQVLLNHRKICPKKEKKTSQSKFVLP